jgi:hypothetical protein
VLEEMLREGLTAARSSRRKRWAKLGQVFRFPETARQCFSARQARMEQVEVLRAAAVLGRR